MPFRSMKLSGSYCEPSQLGNHLQIGGIMSRHSPLTIFQVWLLALLANLSIQETARRGDQNHDASGTDRPGSYSESG